MSEAGTIKQRFPIQLGFARVGISHIAGPPAHYRERRDCFQISYYEHMALRRSGTTLVVRWNGSPENPYARHSCDWLYQPPAWFAIAWACCEADTEVGPTFAAKIIDAGDDDTAALVACDWLEEIGAQGTLLPGIYIPAYELPAHERPVADWIRSIALPPVAAGEPRLDVVTWVDRGLLSSWARLLIAERCLRCGGRKDGEDEINLELDLDYWDRSDPFYAFPDTKAKRSKALEWAGTISAKEPDVCPLCDMPSPFVLPEISIPRVRP